MSSILICPSTICDFPSTVSSRRSLGVTFGLRTAAGPRSAARLCRSFCVSPTSFPHIRYENTTRSPRDVLSVPAGVEVVTKRRFTNDLQSYALHETAHVAKASVGLCSLWGKRDDCKLAACAPVRRLLVETLSDAGFESTAGGQLQPPSHSRRYDLHGVRLVGTQ